MTNLKLLSLNVRGLGNFKKRKTIFSWCKRQKADLIFLQETHSTKETENRWKNEWGGKNVFFSHGKSNARGSCILVANNLNFQLQKQVTDNYGRLVLLKASVDDTSYIFVNIYGPNNSGEAVDFFNKLKLILSSEDVSCENNVVIGGDFNCVLNPMLDRNPSQSNDPKIPVANSIRNIMNCYELQDVWRLKNPSKRSYTWCHPGKFQFSRIDYWLTSSHLQDFCTDTDIHYGIKSDHSAITLTIQINQTRRGPGFWKFNESLLLDKEYTASTSALIKSIMAERHNFSNINSLWEWLKYNIRKHAIDFSKRKAFQNRKKEKELEIALNLAHANFERNPSNSTKLDLEKAKYELEKLLEEKTNGLIKRSKVRWYEEGERSTKYFLNLEKRNYSKKTVNKLLVNDTVITDPKEILKAQMEFYKRLYSAEGFSFSEENFDAFISGCNTPNLSVELKEMCEGEMTLKECENVLNSFMAGKSPGNDGITAEFYKHFWSVLGPVMVESYNFSFHHQQMPLSQTQAVITLIEKKDSDKSLLKNWRPISLLNVDYKIASKVIAYRIKEVLPSLINPSQTAYVKGRYIGETLRLIEDVLSFTDEENIPGILLGIDFEKAFDSLDFNFISQSLKLFGFGQSLVDWVNLFYKHPSSCVINNGFSSAYFGVKRGVRQGDPLSPYLFVLAVEILALVIRNNQNIRGIFLGRKEIKLVQYADDTTLFVDNVKSAYKVLDTFNSFEKISGLKVNLDKSEAMWLGSKKNVGDKPLPLKWCTCMKILGVYFSYDLDIRLRLNFDMLIPSMTRIINFWRLRDLTIYGKIVLIKTLILSKLTYKAGVINIPEQLLTGIERLIFRFLWKGPDKIKRKTVCAEFPSGGINMANIKNIVKSLKLSWISRFLTTVSVPWKWYLECRLENVGGLGFLLQCNFDNEFVNSLAISPFYKELLKIWANDIIGNDSRQGFNQIIWNNKNVKINYKSVYYKSFLLVGIKFVRDLFIRETSNQSFNYWTEKGLDKRHFMRWCGLRSATWRFYKESLTGYHHPSRIDLDFKINTKKGNSYEINARCNAKFFYNLLMQNEDDIFPIYSQHLIEVFQLQGIDDLKKFYTLTYKVTGNPKLRELQYRIHTFIYNTNVILRRKKLKDSALCEFCSAKDQDLYHLFFDCEIIADFWLKIMKYFNQKMNSGFTINKKDVILGNLMFPKILNFVILMGKFCIHLCHIKSENPSLECFLVLLRDKYNIEKEIAKRKNNLVKFEKDFPFAP